QTDRLLIESDVDVRGLPGKNLDGYGGRGVAEELGLEGVGSRRNVRDGKRAVPARQGAEARALDADLRARQGLPRTGCRDRALDTTGLLGADGGDANCGCEEKGRNGGRSA